MDLSDLRREYETTGLDEADAHSDPFAQFAEPFHSLSVWYSREMKIAVMRIAA